jgi:hypothetical protein
MKLCCYFWLSLLLCCVVRPLCANGPEAAGAPLAWELTPYRIQLCVVVQPSARLLASQEAEWSEQLAARANALHGGPWQVMTNQKFAAARNRWQRELPQTDPLAVLETDKEVDKVIFVAVREEAGQFQIAAREWDVTTRLWNVPVARQTAQVGLIATEALAAVQEAFAPLVRIDEIVDQSSGILCRTRGGAIPKQDGSFLSLPAGTLLRPLLISTDKLGMPQPATCSVIPSTYLTVTTPASATGNNRGVLTCSIQHSLQGDIFPAYHPAQLRLAIGLARSSLPVRVRVVDSDIVPTPETPAQPLIGYEVRRTTREATPGKATEKPAAVTNHNGYVERVELQPGLNWLIIARGNTQLAARPIVAGLQSEVVIAVKNDRRRLELAAALAELNDDLLDTLARQAILALRQRDAVLKRDISLTGKLSQELRANANNPRLAARLAELEKQVASTDPATQDRLVPELQQAKKGVEQLQAALAAME